MKHVRHGIEYTIELGDGRLLISLHGGRRPLMEVDLRHIGPTRPMEYHPEFDPVAWARRYISSGALDKHVYYALRGMGQGNRLPELEDE